MSRDEDFEHLEHGGSFRDARVTGRSDGGAAPRVPDSDGMENVPAGSRQALGRLLRDIVSPPDSNVCRGATARQTAARHARCTPRLYAESQVPASGTKGLRDPPIYDSAMDPVISFRGRLVRPSRQGDPPGPRPRRLRGRDARPPRAGAARERRRRSRWSTRSSSRRRATSSSRERARATGTPSG